MKNLILQIWDNNDLPEAETICTSYVKAYAAKWGHSYHLEQTRPYEGLQGTAQKLFLLEPMFDYYDNVCLLDADFIPHPNAPDVFTQPGHAEHGGNRGGWMRDWGHLICDTNRRDIHHIYGSWYKFSREERQLLQPHWDYTRYLNKRTMDEPIFYDVFVRANFAPENGKLAQWAEYYSEGPNQEPMIHCGPNGAIGHTNKAQTAKWVVETYYNKGTKQ